MVLLSLLTNYFVSFLFPLCSCCICQPWTAGMISLAMPHTSNLNSYYCLALGLYVGFSNTLRKVASDNLSSLYLCSLNPAEVLACKDKGTFILLNEAAGLELWISPELCHQNHTVTKMLLLIKTKWYWGSICTLPSSSLAWRVIMLICELC